MKYKKDILEITSVNKRCSEKYTFLETRKLQHKKELLNNNLYSVL